VSIGSTDLPGYVPGNWSIDSLRLSPRRFFTGQCNDKHSKTFIEFEKTTSEKSLLAQVTKAHSLTRSFQAPMGLEIIGNLGRRRGSFKAVMDMSPTKK
jgi:hypothetical protein